MVHMKHREGELSTPIKILIVALAGAVVLLVYLTAQEDMLNSIRGPVRQLIFGAVGDF